MFKKITFPNPRRDEFMSHISEGIKKLHDEGKEISLAFYETMYLNSYEAKYIESLLSDEAFVRKIENAIKNSRDLLSYELPRHYDEYLSTDGVRELLKRFIKKVNN